MIEDKEVKIAESPEEALLKQTIDATESRLRELKLTTEIQIEMLKFLKRKAGIVPKLPIDPKVNKAVN